jgi:hypothetical protein
MRAAAMTPQSCHKSPRLCPKSWDLIFCGGHRLTAARKILAYLKEYPNPRPLADAARRLIFLKGTNVHDYKFSSAVLED